MAKAGILIVEDSYIVAFHLKRTLENEGYDVISIQTEGEGAIEILRQQRADVVLMDIMLAGEMDGIETASIIQNQYDIPVIYITSLKDKPTVQRAKVTEPYGYLTKPFEDNDIITVLDMALYKHQIEFKLRRSEEQYFSTIRSISDAVIIFDQNFRISYINPSAEAITGWILAEAREQMVFDVLRLKDTDTSAYPVNPVQCDLNPAHVNTMPGKLVLIDKLGREKAIGESSISPILDHKNTMLGLILIFKDLTDKLARKALQKDLDKQRLTAMVEGQENERSRIAKDLHDGLGQMLNAIKMNVRMVVKDEKKAQFLFNAIDEAIQETVRISENLLPAKLRDFDLITCLKSLCTTFRKSSRVDITFDAHFSDLNITQSRKINVYRVAQEALTNAIRHASASKITLQLIQDDEKIRLSVEDDGHGLDSPPAATYLSMKRGMGNMRDRAEIMGGKLTVESDPNRGTLIVLEVPLKNRLTRAEV